METDFPVVKLGDVAEVRSGFAFKSSDMGTIGLPLIKIKNITPPTVEAQDIERVPEEVLKSIPRAERYKLEHRDILIAITTCWHNRTTLSRCSALLMEAHRQT